MIPNPIRKVLSSIRAHRVRALLMGGQACVFYGGAEFSRDTDFVILADHANLSRLHKALADLQAEPIAVPPFSGKYLRRGHAIRFRCNHPEALRMRVDVMSRMRGVEGCAALWKRRTTIRLPDGEVCDLLSLPDLIQAKKTQRDKDWPMIPRLGEAHYFENRKKPSTEQLRFWFQELRTSEPLAELAHRYPVVCKQAAKGRGLLALAMPEKVIELEDALRAEEIVERERDRKYWIPLRLELERLRHARLKL